MCLEGFCGEDSLEGSTVNASLGRASTFNFRPGDVQMIGDSLSTSIVRSLRREKELGKVHGWKDEGAWCSKEDQADRWFMQP
jgi:hypothetical protein